MVWCEMESPIPVSQRFTYTPFVHERGDNAVLIYAIYLRSCTLQFIVPAFVRVQDWDWVRICFGIGVRWLGVKVRMRN
jgi:hypothetical protein